LCPHYSDQPSLYRYFVHQLNCNTKITNFNDIKSCRVLINA
jgi:hypothetical protein